MIKSTKVKNYLMIIIFLILIPSLNISQAAPMPDKVTFGVYPMKIYNLDPATNSFNISFYAWWHGQNKNYKPANTVAIINAQEYHVKAGSSTIIDKNKTHSYAQYFAKINQVWNVKYFPFDRQYLTIQMEDEADTNFITFIPDRTNSIINPELIIPGWKIINFSMTESQVSYASNFGDINANSSFYDRLSFIIEVKRLGIRAYFSYFIGFFIAVLLASLIYIMLPFPFPARATIFTAAIFSFVGNKYIIDQKIPFTSEFTLADAIQASTIVIIFLSIVTSIILEFTSFSVEKKQNISIIAGAISILLYILVLGTLHIIKTSELI